jgi:phosphonate degradation associated HDIG domain protein
MDMSIKDIFSIYSHRGSSLYIGESVTVAQHALQSAHFARAAGASDALVVAALLHDIGHLVETVPDDIGDWETDAHHELVGSRWLAALFGPQVYEPVRLHVSAKRYLCATEPEYLRTLSMASVQTLKLQGGPMSAVEAAAFRSESYHSDAVMLRQCDDQAKVVNLKTPDFNHYRALIEQQITG